MGCLHLAMALADREVEMENKSLVFENLHRAIKGCLHLAMALADRA